MSTEYGEYKNFYYRITGIDVDDIGDNMLCCEGFIKIDNLDENFCTNNHICKCYRWGGRWYMLINLYYNKSNMLTKIFNVIDEIEKQYEPGGIEFEKARTFCENL